MLRRKEEAWPLRVVNQFGTLEEFKSFPVSANGIKLGDVATVALAEPELDYGRHLDRGRAIGLNVIKESGANTVAVAKKARELLKELEADPQLKGIRVITFTDQGEQIQNSISGLAHAGIVGALLATAVLLFFLRRPATTLIVAGAIPLSLLAAAAVLYFGGRSLNILSMMGLMLAVVSMLIARVGPQSSFFSCSTVTWWSV